MSNGYEQAWKDLGNWLDTQYEYVMIPVKMVRRRMHENEDTYIEEEE